MPEGHTLHRLARRHRTRFAGKQVSVTSPQGRFATSAEIVDGLTLRRADAHGKHLFHHYGPDLVVHVHLGLYGSSPTSSCRSTRRAGSSACGWWGRRTTATCAAPPRAS